MKVKQLIKELSKLDGERIVIMQSDGEGNGYSPLEDFWEGSYLAESTWSGSAGLEKLTASDKRAGYSDDDVIDGEKAVIFVPVN